MTETLPDLDPTDLAEPAPPTEPTLTAVALTREGRVRLMACDPSSTEDAAGRLVRTDANGAALVRLVAGQSLALGPLVVTDHEAAITGTITYTLTCADGRSLSASVTLAGAADHLAPVQLPQYGTNILMVTGYEMTAASQSLVHWVIGRPDPLGTLGPLQSPAGVWTIPCLTFGQAQAVRAACSHNAVLLRTAEPGADQYAIPTQLTISRDEQTGCWLVRIEVTAIPRPAGAQLGATDWTLDAVAAAHESLDDVALTYDSLTDLEVGPWPI